MRPPVGLPRLSRRSRTLIIIGAALLIALIAGSRLLDTYIDWLWFGEVAERSVFSTVVLTRALLFLIGGLFVGGLLAVNLIIAYRTRPVFVPVSGPDDPVARYRTGVLARLRLIGIGVPVLVGFIAATSAQSEWRVVQLFLNSVPFGVTDPQFNRDIGFYAFRLPFYTSLLSWAFVAIALAFIGALITHYLFGGIRLANRGGQLSVPARIQLAVLAGLFVLLKAVAYYFDRYELLFSDRNLRFSGATYTDLNAVLPAKMILLFIAVFCALVFFAGAFLRNLQLPAIALVLLVLSSLLVGAGWPAVLQQFVVTPNAQDKEADPIRRNIAATKQAFALTEDKVKYVQYPGKTNLEPAEVRSDPATIPNARLLDPNLLNPTFTQLQQKKNVYGFPEKLDIDRYQVNGKVRDYIVAAREIDPKGLASTQQDWINRHLVYTHGNGLVAAQANTVNSTLDKEGGEGGYPAFTVSEVGTNGQLVQGDIKVDQPRIYYGEVSNDYAIVRAKDGPREYDTDTSKYSYTGSGGVSIGNWFDRLVFAAHYGERNLLFSGAIGDESKLIFKRDPRDRVSAVAPWLTVDTDAYPAVVNGRVKWIVDGYTTLEKYPYAQRTELGEATNDAVVRSVDSLRKQPNKMISYIRNSVKATVDAYDGSVTLYEVDGKDPVLKAWEGVFPGVVKPNSDIPQELRDHFRYPEDMFKVQRQLLTQYHVTDPGDFFKSVSFWGVPRDPTIDPAGQQPPYYVLAGDPEKPAVADFQLTSALTGQGRDFLAGYVTARSDPQNYGQITVLTLPTDTQTKGPVQIHTQFLSSPQVSSELNVLRQQATKVVYGNLLTLPVGGGVLYVEPVYIERSGQTNSFPQLAKVLVSFGGKVGYAATLNQALDQVFGAGAGDTAPKPPSTDPAPPNTNPPTPGGQLSPEMSKAVEDIGKAIERVRKAQQSGDFGELGQAYKDLDDASKRFDAARKASGG
ncbi:UPF0182 family protein [Pseudonocardiaceae bacterium YIM PH 21723]|nr:UPF0182 family protein [Pseudonocardiaceae bacterium YIM PH 21723]